MYMSEEARQAMNAYQKEYRQRNPEKIKAAKRRYREKNREKIAAYNKQWRHDNPEKVSEYQRRYWEKKAATASLIQEEEEGKLDS